MPAANAIEIPDGIPAVDATVIPDAVATPYHVANQRANIRLGNEVAVLGAGGGVGIHMIQVASYFGADVTAVDAAREKLDRCADVGAVRVHDSGPGSDLEPIADVDYDAVIDFTRDADLIAADWTCSVCTVGW